MTQEAQIPIITIEQAGQHAGQSVTIRGWLYNQRESGKLLFPIFRDGTGVMQGVLSLKEHPEAFAAMKGMTQESSIIVTGKIQAEPRAPGGFEIHISGVRRGAARAGIFALPDSAERARRGFPARPAASVDSHATAGGDSEDSRAGRARGAELSWTGWATRSPMRRFSLRQPAKALRLSSK